MLAWIRIDHQNLFSKTKNKFEGYITPTDIFNRFPVQKDHVLCMIEEYAYFL